MKLQDVFLSSQKQSTNMSSNWAPGTSGPLSHRDLPSTILWGQGVGGRRRRNFDFCGQTIGFKNYVQASYALVKPYSQPPSVMNKLDLGAT